MKQPLFEGVCTALVTPFADGEIQFSQLEQLIDWQIASGVPALVIGGTTGEASALSPAEHMRLIAHAVRYADGRCKILAGTGSSSAVHALEMSRFADSAGADGLLVVTPYYSKANEAGLLDYYGSIADSVRIPVILYNVPSRTGLDLSVEICQKLSRHPNIGGIKEASEDMSKVARLLQSCQGQLPVWSGNDHQTLPVLSLGGSGVISVLSNLIPAALCHMVSRFFAGEIQEAAKQQCRLMPLLDALFREVNPIAIKAAMAMAGRDPGPTRAPLAPLSPEHRQELEAAMREAALL